MDEWIYEYVDEWIDAWMNGYCIGFGDLSSWWVGHRLGAADAATRKMLTDATDLVLIVLIPTQRPVPGPPGRGLRRGGVGVFFFPEIDALKLKFPRSTHDFFSLKSSRHTWERFGNHGRKHTEAAIGGKGEGVHSVLFICLFVCLFVFFFFQICEVGGLVGWRSCRGRLIY